MHYTVLDKWTLERPGMGNVLIVSMKTFAFLLLVGKKHSRAILQCDVYFDEKSELGDRNPEGPGR